MNKLEIKKVLIDYCIRHQKMLADNAIQEMKEAYDSASDYGNPEDWSDTYKSDMLNKRDVYGMQLEKANVEINKIGLINPNQIADEVGFGSVVITETQKLFIAVGIGKIPLEDEIYFGISTSVPIYQALKGLKKGDLYNFRGCTGKIIDVF